MQRGVGAQGLPSQPRPQPVPAFQGWLCDAHRGWGLGRVALRGAMTIRCECRCRGARVLLSKAGDPNARRAMDSAGDVVEFPIRRVSQGDAGNYSCQYSTKWDPPVWSEPSDPVELVVAGEGPGSASPLPAPHSDGPSERVWAVGIRPPWFDTNMRFLLYKVGNLNVLQDLEPAGDVAEFPICNVSQRDAGSYRCRYSTKSDPPMWSEPSDPVELVVAGEGPARRPRSQPHTQTDPQKISALRRGRRHWGVPSWDKELLLEIWAPPLLSVSGKSFNGSPAVPQVFQLGFHSSSPCCFREASFSLAFRCPSDCYSGDGISFHLKHTTDPSPTPPGNDPAQILLAARCQ
uniref:Ig-like domain-containing protein n=1 Tax=Chrysemys picta bellii TaxID=8478 RepID=A0A8C3HMX7_CHRPI